MEARTRKTSRGLTEGRSEGRRRTCCSTRPASRLCLSPHSLRLPGGLRDPELVVQRSMPARTLPHDSELLSPLRYASHPSFDGELRPLSSHAFYGTARAHAYDVHVHHGTPPVTHIQVGGHVYPAPPPMQRTELTDWVPYPYVPQWSSQPSLAPGWLPHAPRIALGPMAAPPPLLHKVWIVDCNTCGMFLTNRGMKVSEPPLRLASGCTKTCPLGGPAAASKRTTIFDRRDANQLLLTYCYCRADCIVVPASNRDFISGATPHRNPDMRVPHPDALVPWLRHGRRLHDCDPLCPLHIVYHAEQQVDKRPPLRVLFSRNRSERAALRVR